MCKQSANSGTKEGIRSQAWFFSIVEKTEVIASETVKKSEWMTLVIWDFLGVDFWTELINIINHMSSKVIIKVAEKHNNYNLITPLI